MKTLLIALGALLALVHLGLAFSTTTIDPTVLHAGTAVVGVLVAIVALTLPSRTSSPSQPTPPPSPPTEVPAPRPAPVVVAPTPVTVATPPASVSSRPEAEVVAFLALLQEKGRLVDFLKEDLMGASDAQVGTAARVVHAGCRSVLNEYLEIVPVRTENEGSSLTLHPGYDAAAHRLLGSVPAQPPYQGILVHPGWQVQSVKLPRVTGTQHGKTWPVLAPAEVEITKS